MADESAANPLTKLIETFGGLNFEGLLGLENGIGFLAMFLAVILLCFVFLRAEISERHYKLIRSYFIFAIAFVVATPAIELVRDIAIPKAPEVTETALHIAPMAIPDVSEDIEIFIVHKGENHDVLEAAYFA
ncbi:MAG: hypothetical protein AAF638_04295, partial [Pseudomonadota bacterium]